LLLGKRGLWGEKRVYGLSNMVIEVMIGIKSVRGDVGFETLDASTQFII